MFDPTIRFVPGVTANEPEWVAKALHEDITSTSRMIVWFSQYNEKDPERCIAETTIMSAERCYVWLLLRYVFDKLKFRTRTVPSNDVCRFVSDLWVDPWYDIYLNMYHEPNHTFAMLYDRFCELVDIINVTEINVITPEGSRIQLFTILRKSDSFWRDQVRQAERLDLDFQESVGFFQARASENHY